jgi:hypothetical protein
MKDSVQVKWLLIVAALLLLLSSSCTLSRPWLLVDAFLPLFPVSSRRNQLHPIHVHARPRRATTLLGAKKSKKGKKNAKQTTSGFAWASSFTIQPYEAQSTRELVSMALATFQAKTGRPLCEDLTGGVTDIPKAFWKTPSVACVIVENRSNNNDGTRSGGQVKYANLAALETVGLAADQWEQLIVMNPSPGRQSTIVTTDKVNRNSNNNDDDENESSKSMPTSSSCPNTTILLDLPADMKGGKTHEKGYEKKILRRHHLMMNGENHHDNSNMGHYPHDVRILNAHRWKIETSTLVSGTTFVPTLVGVAYAWKEWVLNDTTICSPGGQRREMVHIEAIQQAVEEQGNKIRRLKQEQGLGNKDPRVQEAVAELLRLKGLLAAA